MLHVSGFRQFAQMPIHFRFNELPLMTRMLRHINGSMFDRHFIMTGLYLGVLAGCCCINWILLSTVFFIFLKKKKVI